jgi:hypothetical protein
MSRKNISRLNDSQKTCDRFHSFIWEWSRYHNVLQFEIYIFFSVLVLRFTFWFQFGSKINLCEVSLSNCPFRIWEARRLQFLHDVFHDQSLTIIRSTSRTWDLSILWTSLTPTDRSFGGRNPLKRGWSTFSYHMSPQKVMKNVNS